MTKEQFNKEYDSIEHAVHFFQQMHHEQIGSPKNIQIVYDRQEDRWIVQMMYAPKFGFEWVCDTAFEIKAQILADAFNSIQDI